MSTKLKQPTQKEKRQGIDVGPGMFEVSPVAWWYRNGHFRNDQEAQGAFKLAHQQGLDGMGSSIHEWMGLTPEEYAAWHRNDTLPLKRR